MRQLARVLTVASLGCALTWTIGGPSAAAPAKACSKGKVTRIANGARACVPAARFRQDRTPPPSASAVLLAQTVQGGPITLRLKNGRPARPPRPRALVTAVSRRYAAAQEKLVASVEGALTQTAAARSHELGFTGGSVTRSADGASATANIGFGGSAGGHTVNGTIEIGASASGKFDIGMDITVADPTGATKSTGFTGRDILTRGAGCPDSAGNLTVKSGHDVSSRSGETFGSKRVHLGTVREGTTSTASSRAQVAFGPDGAARPFAVTVEVSLDSARSAQVLAFLSARTRAVGRGTMTGTVDPATGKVSGATVTTSGRTSGYSGGQAAADAQLRAALEAAMNDEVGRLLDKVREAEKNCRGPFEVTLSLTTNSTFATHTASGTLNATLIATRSAAGTFTGSAPVAYENLAFTSTIGCAYLDPQSPGATFDATITVDPDGRLKVKWSAGDGSAGSLATSATIQCPAVPPDGPPPPIPGQPGPRLLLPAPTEFDLPLAGGKKAIGGGFQEGSDGWTHDGTVTVTRVVR